MEPAPPVSGTPVSSIVIIGVGGRGSDGYLHVDTGCGLCLRGHCRASQDGSGHAERYDSGNNDSSPDAHDPSMAITAGQRPGSCPAGLHGASISCEGISQFSGIMYIYEVAIT